MRLLMLSFVLAVAAPAFASDGVLEINQTCALSAAGCFPGDVGGSFPVTITQSGTSYRLTSSLQVPDANTTAIRVTPFDASVSIDLNGFTIRGITACTAGGGQPAVCSPRGSGVGISAGGNTRIRNGFVTHMGSHGIDLSSGRVEDVVAFMNGGDGIRGGEAVTVHAVEAVWNHENGINLTISGVVTNSIANGNGLAGINVVHGNVVDSLSERNGTFGAAFGVVSALHGNLFAENAQGSLLGAGLATGGNYCDDGRCSRTGTRRFFLSQATADGGSASFACPNAAAGFHMASVWELLDPSNFVYDTTLGVTLTNAGSGPPADNTGTPGPVDGWIRDGLAASTGNCSAWTSGSSAQSGLMGALYRNGAFGYPDPASGADGSPWGIRGAACNVPQNVWCVEN